MISLATYLSLNLWIRGIFEFSLTLFLVGSLDLKYILEDTVDPITILSKISAISFGLFLIFIMALIIRYFIKNKVDDKWK
jgi:hypothetical protein